MAINESKGQSGSYSRNQQIIGRELLTPAEVGLLEMDECLVFIRGVKPFKSQKFKIESHKRYRELSDYNADNYFDIKSILLDSNINDDNVINIDISEINQLAECIRNNFV